MHPLLAWLSETVKPEHPLGRYYTWYLALLLVTALGELEVMEGSKFLGGEA